MQDNGMTTTTRPTGKSALGLIAIVVLIVALIAAVAWAFTRPGFLDELMNILIIVVVALVVIAIVAYIAYAILAVAYFAKKGEVVQTGVSHRLDDVKGVEGNTLDENHNDKQ